MSKCISPQGEYSEHEIGPDFVCKLCFAFDEDAALAHITELTRELAASRARFGDLEARLVEAEAVIAAAREAAQPTANGEPLRERVIATLDAYRPVVLADHDKEVAARALEDAADWYWGPLQVGRNVYAVEMHFRDRAASIRSGSEGDNR